MLLQTHKATRALIFIIVALPLAGNAFNYIDTDTNDSDTATITNLAPISPTLCLGDKHLHPNNPKNSFTLAKKFTQPFKEWTFFVYMAADNNLYPFASRNLADMQRIGSNKNLNIVVFLDIKLPGRPKVTKWLYIERGRMIQIGPDMSLDSGSEKTFREAVERTIDNFPSKYLAIDFWNHGSGDLNPPMRRAINPAKLFFYNPMTKKIELDRSIGFMEFIQLSEEKLRHKRGICFSETYKTYLDDAKLMRSLKTIKEKLGKNIDMVIFDACLMAGTGTACIMSQFADYMVASQEVVLGPGYDYHRVVAPLTMGNVNSKEFSHYIVTCYEKTYGNETNDYTHSALQLDVFPEVGANIHTIATLLIDALHKDSLGNIKHILKKSRHRKNCTFFDEPSYIDLSHFYENLLKNLDQLKLSDKKAAKHIKEELKKKLKEGIQLLNRLIIANVAGKHLHKAKGISIFFPEYPIRGPYYGSFYQTEFAKNNAWAQFLKLYFA